MIPTSTKKVSVLSCPTYDTQAIYEAVKHGFGQINAQELIRPGMRVAIKPNLLMRIAPDKHATTHPAVVAAIARCVRELGAYPIIVESPGGPMGDTRIRGVYEGTGIAQIAQGCGTELNYDMSPTEVFDPNAKVLKTMTLLSAIVNADVVISAAKLKTHQLTGITAAVKNLYGCVPGMKKVEYHYTLPDIVDFSDMLVDICQYVQPVISVIDAVTAMEGAGPTGGTPKNVGAIIVSDNAHAADAAASFIMNGKPTDFPTLQRAFERGLLENNLSDVEYTDLRPQELAVKDFKQADTRDKASIVLGRLPRPVRKVFERLLTTRPVVVPKSCRGCGECERSCPAKAITIDDKIPQFNYKACIRCYCCQELCPHKAINVKKPFLTRM